MFDENLSWYLNANIKYYLKMEETSVKKDDGFEESNRMHGTGWCALRAAGMDPQDPGPCSLELGLGAALDRLRFGGQRVGRGTSSCLRAVGVSYEQAVFPVADLPCQRQN